MLNVARARYSDSMRLVAAVQHALEAAAWAKVRSEGTDATHLPDTGARALAARAAALTLTPTPTLTLPLPLTLTLTLTLTLS